MSIDRLVTSRSIAEGLPVTGVKNPWVCRATVGLSTSFVGGAGPGGFTGQLGIEGSYLSNFVPGEE